MTQEELDRILDGAFTTTAQTLDSYTSLSEPAVPRNEFELQESQELQRLYEEETFRLVAPVRAFFGRPSTVPLLSEQSVDEALARAETLPPAYKSALAEALLGIEALMLSQPVGKYYSMCSAYN